MLKRSLHIIIGWAKRFRLIETTDVETKLMELRLRICRECQFSKHSKTLRIINGEARQESSMKCTICKCPCEQKALVAQESCPKNKW